MTAIPTNPQARSAAEANPSEAGWVRSWPSGPRPAPDSAVGSASLLATVLVAIAVLGLLLIWHLRRRAQLIRDRLGPPRAVSLADLSRAGDDEPRPPAGVPDSAAR